MAPIYLYLLPLSAALRQEQSAYLCCVAEGTNFDRGTLLKVAQYLASEPKWSAAQGEAKAMNLLKSGFYMDPEPLERLTGKELDDVARLGS